MSRESLYACISQAVPCVHVSWGRGNAPALPWAVFYGRRDDLGADDGNYKTVWRWTVELYQLAADPDVEDALMGALSEFGYVSRGEEAYLSDEGCIMTPFYVNEIERED